VPPAEGQSARPRLIVLFDRDCGICVVAARRLGRWDRHRALELVGLQDAAADERELVRDTAASHPLHAELHVLDPASGVVRAGGMAMLEIVGRLPGGRVPAALGRLAPAAWAIGVGYALVARNRGAIGRALRLEARCAVPSPPRSLVLGGARELPGRDPDGGDHG
jgi:predicted DCC family thiol-disulfide oxidoreductase YuxK